MVNKDINVNMKVLFVVGLIVLLSAVSLSFFLPGKTITGFAVNAYGSDTCLPCVQKFENNGCVYSKKTLCSNGQCVDDPLDCLSCYNSSEEGTSDLNNLVSDFNLSEEVVFLYMNHRDFNSTSIDFSPFCIEVGKKYF